MTMNLMRDLIRPYLYLRYGFHRLTGTGAFRSDRARYIASSEQPQWNGLKQALWKNHVKQFHESSCSVASVVACINAIRSLENGDTAPISQADILDRVPTGHWKARMSNGGYQGRRGLPLPLLGQVVKDSLSAYGLTVQTVDVVRTPKKLAPTAPIRTALRQRLIEFDEQGNGLILCHFDQGALVPTLNIPHISPVGAYDATADRVTMLDVDPEQENPYEVDFDTFYAGLSSDYQHVFEAYGYGSGGYVYIQIR
jgi:hypothetical protein